VDEEEEEDSEDGEDSVGHIEEAEGEVVDHIRAH
jgi:hypothetical protein